MKEYSILFNFQVFDSNTDPVKTPILGVDKNIFQKQMNGPRSLLSVIDQLKEEVQKWNKDYYELLEYRKNPTLGRMKCSKCLLSGSNDDPLFVGIEKVFARIVSKQCNNNANMYYHNLITYHCNVMNIFSCPFESKESYNNRDGKGEEESK